MRFIDEAEITVRSGDGGAGCVHFRREKYKPRMGPDGGSGGRGGHVYFKSTHNLQSLVDFKYKRNFAAPDGNNGSNRDCDGKAGQDLIIELPVGTVIKDAKSSEVLLDLNEKNKEALFLKGGRGGLGNMYFANSVRQAPDFAQPGESGEELKIKLELRVLADLALVGFPNAGKSTLISSISAAKPRIADYPFTTLVPNLGIVRHVQGDFSVADIPGLIEGAHQGKGLGHRFLKHCQRSSLICFVLDLDPNQGQTLPEQYQTLKNELNTFSADFRQKKQMLVINKNDLAGDPELLEEMEYEILKRQLKDEGLAYFSISAFAKKGLEEFLSYAAASVSKDKKARRELIEEQKSDVLILGNKELFESRPEQQL